MTVVNEKGNSRVPLKYANGSTATTVGDYIGSIVLNEYFIVFTHVNSTTDNIYRLKKKKDNMGIGEDKDKEYFELLLLFSGNLNLNPSSPIETTAIFENADI